MSFEHHLDQVLAASTVIGSIPFDGTAPFTDALLDTSALRIRDAEPGERGLFEIANPSAPSASEGVDLFSTTHTGLKSSSSRKQSSVRVTNGFSGDSRAIRKASIGAITGLSVNSQQFATDDTMNDQGNNDTGAFLKAISKLLSIYPMQDCTAHLDGLRSRFEETRSKTDRLEERLQQHKLEAQDADKENKRASLTPPKAGSKHSRQSIRPPGARMSMAPGHIQGASRSQPVPLMESPRPALADTIRKEEHDILALESMMAERQRARDGLDEKIRDVEEIEKERKRARDAEAAKENLARQEAEQAQLQKGNIEAHSVLEKEIESMTRELEELERAGGIAKNPVQSSFDRLKYAVEHSSSPLQGSEIATLFEELRTLVIKPIDDADTVNRQGATSDEENDSIARHLMQAVLSTKLRGSEKTPPQTILSAFLLTKLLESPEQVVPLAQLKDAVGQKAEEYAATAVREELKKGYTLDAGIKALYGLVANRVIVIDRSGREGMVRFVS